jgi:glyoxylase-like metal-dependent hydrolase (beta-lactamase superfamily II)
MRLFATILLVALSCAAPAAPRDLADGRLMPPEKVAEHVWVMRQPDRLWAAVIGNVTIVEQSDGMVLIDSGGSIADGRDVVAGVKSLTAKPVKAVAITHWHNDHPLGLPGILEAFPRARVISTPQAREHVQSETNTSVGKPSAEMDAARRERIAKSLAELEAEAADPKSSPEMRAQWAIELDWIRRRLDRLMGNYVVVPGETVADTLVIDDPVAPVELKVLGTGNTTGDLVAWLPRQKVVAAGDMVVAPTPYGFTVSTTPWLATLGRLEQLPFEALIPGHGKVQRDRAYLGTLNWSMREIAAKAAAAAADTSLTKEQAIAAFDRKPHEARFGAADAWTRKWLNDYWLEGMFGTAFDEARGIPAPGK